MILLALRCLRSRVERATELAGWLRRIPLVAIMRRLTDAHYNTEDRLAYLAWLRRVHRDPTRLGDT